MADFFLSTMGCDGFGSESGHVNAGAEVDSLTWSAPVTNCCRRAMVPFGDGTPESPTGTQEEGGNCDEEPSLDHGGTEATGSTPEGGRLVALPERTTRGLAVAREPSLADTATLERPEESAAG